jgi:hypothetical protein
LANNSQQARLESQKQPTNNLKINQQNQQNQQSSKMPQNTEKLTSVMLNGKPSHVG